MSIFAEFDKLTKAKICQLVYENEIIAYRVRLYDMEKRKFTLNDFYLDIVEDEEILKFISDNTSQIGTTTLELRNGALITKEELEQNVAVNELESKEEVEKILKMVIKILNFNTMMNS